MKLLVKNTPNSHSTGDVIFIGDDSHEFGKMESLTKFLDAGGVKSEWPYHFVIVNVLGVSPESYAYLLDVNGDGTKKYHIEPQTPDSIYWNDITKQGEVSLPQQEFNDLIRSR